MNLCEYGCGQEAQYQLKNGKWCCESHFLKCSIIRKKLSKGHKGKKSSKPILIETYELCSYGCGQIAKYKFKNGKYCCSDNINKCPINRNKIKNNQKGWLIETTELCSYGCEQIAKFKFKNGKICCSKYYTQCPINCKKRSKSLRGKIHLKAISIKTIKLCSYGCGQIAKFKLKNGKYCCSESQNICPENRKKRSESKKLTIPQIKEKNPTFYKEEPMRYNPDKPNENEIQVRCKNNKCKNSKEQDGWFTPTYSQLRGRIDSIEKPWGHDGKFLYCSDECKGGCKLFNKRGDPNKETKKLPYTQGELDIWRQEIFRLQREEYNTKINFCEMCDSTENLHAHHYKPVKLYPGLALDPDNGHILCSKCHYEYGHKTGTECSTGNLANVNPCD